MLKREIKENQDRQKFVVIIPYVEGTRIFVGKTLFDAAMLEALDEPIKFIHAGELTIDSDVTPE